MSNKLPFQLAPGEEDPCAATFSPSLVLFWLHTNMMCTNRRFVHNSPNTLLGVIPLGQATRTFPVNNIASVDTNTSFQLKRFLLGLILFFVSFGVFSSSFFIGFLLLVAGVVFLLTSFPTALILTNNAGGTSEILVSVLEKDKMAQFANQIQDRVYRDQAQLHHVEAQNLRQQQLNAQMQQAWFMQQQAQGQVMHPETGQPMQPPQNNQQQLNNGQNNNQQQLNNGQNNNSDAANIAQEFGWGQDPNQANGGSANNNN